MRRHVTPALPDAAIPDSARGDTLPPAGRTVEWSPYWAGRLMRSEIVAAEIAADAAVDAVPAPEAGPPASPEPEPARRRPR